MSNPLLTHQIEQLGGALTDLAAALGGYYFNFTNLEPHLEPSDDPLPDNYSCVDGVGRSERARTPLVAASPGSHYFLQRVAASF